MRGVVSFEESWMDKQGYSSSQNFLSLLFDRCSDKDIGVCTITSDCSHISRDSPQDRFHWLIHKYAKRLPSGYNTGNIGPNIFIVGHGDKMLYLVNGQLVEIQEKEKKLHALVIGSNEVPNRKSFKETQAFCNDRNLISIAGHIGMDSYQGNTILEENLDEFDALEGYNARFRFPNGMRHLPMTNMGFYIKAKNQEAKRFAIRHNKPYIAISDTHSLKGIGSAYISFRDSYLMQDDESHFLKSIKTILRKQDFATYEGYCPLFSWPDSTF